MKLTRHILPVAFLVCCLCRADTIEFWKGKRITDAEVVGVRDGVLLFTYGHGKRGRAKVMEVKNLVRSRPAPAADDANAPCRLLGFDDYTDDDDSGKKITVGIRAERERIREPLLRIFALQEDEKGERKLYLYQNHRVHDPSLVYAIPEITAQEYAAKAFFLKTDGAVVGWRLEIWLDGRLAFEKEKLQVEAPEGWWRNAKVSRTRRLEELTDAKAAAGAADGGEEEDDFVMPQVQCRVTQCHLAQGLDRPAPVWSVGWLLSSAQTRISLPEVTLYYLTEDRRGRRDVVAAKCEPDAGQEVAIDRRLSRRATVAVPSRVVVGGKGFAGVEDERVKRVVYWRLEVAYDGHALTVRESPDQGVGATLDDHWWEK